VDADGDGLVDTIYAGDLKGNMHKFQFSKLVGTKYVLANPTDTGAAWLYLGKVYASGEPIVSAPSVALSCKGTGLNLAFGTGKLNEVNDYTDTAARSFVSLDDLGDTSSLTVPASDLETITLTPDTLANGAAVRKWTAPSLIDKGWRMTFTDGERVLGNSTQPPKTGAIVFGTTKPSGNICIPGNSAYLMSVKRCSGAPALQVDGNPDVGGYASDSAGEFKVSNAYINPNGDPTTVDNQENEGHPLPTSTAPKGRYSWRELLTK
jgi:type IV pilus assembly protein PilY1